MRKLQIILPDGTESTHELTEDVVTVGRLSDNAIRIESPNAGVENPVTQPRTERKVSTLPEPVTNAANACPSSLSLRLSRVKSGNNFP